MDGRQDTLTKGLSKTHSTNDTVPETPCPPADAFSPPAVVTVIGTITLTGYSDLSGTVRY